MNKRVGIVKYRRNKVENYLNRLVGSPEFSCCFGLEFQIGHVGKGDHVVQDNADISGRASCLTDHAVVAVAGFFRQLVPVARKRTDDLNKITKVKTKNKDKYNIIKVQYSQWLISWKLTFWPTLAFTSTPAVSYWSAEVAGYEPFAEQWVSTRVQFPMKINKFYNNNNQILKRILPWQIYKPTPPNEL